MVNPLIALRVDASAPARVAIGAPRQLQNTLLTIENIRQNREANALASQVAQQKATLDASKFNLDVAEFGETQQKNIAAEDEVQRKAALDRSDRMSRLLSTAIQRPELFDRIRQQAVREFPELADKIPEQFDEAFLLGAANQVESVRKQLADGVPLVEIGDASSPTGTRFTPRSEAAGKPGKPPTGFEITTNPDGTTTIRTGVRGGTGGLQKATAGSLEKEIIGIQDGLARLSTISAGFKPEFLQFGPRFDVAVSAFKEKAGIELSSQDQQFLSEFAGFKRDAIENINLEIKRITGAQMSEKEADRIRLGFPDPGEGIFDGDSPTQFKAKFDGILKQLRLAGARKIFTLRNGIQFDQIPLAAMEGVLRERATELSAEGLSDQDIKATLKSEFGL